MNSAAEQMSFVSPRTNIHMRRRVADNFSGGGILSSVAPPKSHLPVQAEQCLRSSAAAAAARACFRELTQEMTVGK